MGSIPGNLTYQNLFLNAFSLLKLFSEMSSRCQGKEVHFSTKTLQTNLLAHHNWLALLNRAVVSKALEF